MYFFLFLIKCYSVPVSCKKSEDEVKDYPTVLAEFSSVVADTQQYIVPASESADDSLIEDEAQQVQNSKINPHKYTFQWRLQLPGHFSDCICSLKAGFSLRTGQLHQKLNTFKQKGYLYIINGFICIRIMMLRYFIVTTCIHIFLKTDDPDNYQSTSLGI